MPLRTTTMFVLGGGATAVAAIRYLDIKRQWQERVPRRTRRRIKQNLRRATAKL